MKKPIAIYLAGRIKKEHEISDETHWTDEDMRCLRKHLDGYEVSFLNPALRSDDLTDQHSVFGRDMLQVFCSDIVFADIRERRGLGVGAEMMWAKLNKIPVVLWAPKNSHYHKSQTTILGTSVKDWVHPFVESLSDTIVENLHEGAAWIHQVMSDPSCEIKDLAFIEAAMLYYKENQLDLDEPMKAIMNSNALVNRRMKFLSSAAL